jgi:hypothetical protein
MYGLVNKAVEQLVRTTYGEKTWLEIAQKAQTDPSFIMMKTYPDQVTFDLVAAASEVLETPAVQILEAFGEHWIQFTVDEGYGALISLYGDSVPEFLDNMDSLHAQIRLSFPQLRPPSITCVTKPNGQLIISYVSERAGLAPMLVGLVRGLGKRFATPVDVEYLAVEHGETFAEKFLVTFLEQHEKAA